MIQPEDIRRKAIRLYPGFLQAWLEGGPDGFPRIIAGRKKPDHDVAKAAQQIQCLREDSKEVLGYGYSVTWRKINSRQHGRNWFPTEISFETSNDLIRYIKKNRDFDQFRDVVGQIRSAVPQLETWMRRNIRTLSQLASNIAGLIEVATYLKDHPRPNCFVRELPLSVDTKFIEQHKRELRQWLDILLPAHSIRADEDHFERRFGLRYAEPHLLIRFLDPALQAELGFPCEVLSLPLHTLATLQITSAHAIIVENKVNLLTLPQLPRTVALGGLGNAVTLLRYAEFIASLPVTYWGDIDVEAFMILSSLRTFCPHAKSLWMDQDAVKRWQHLKIDGTGRQPTIPAHLTNEERSAFEACCQENIRIEQERLPQTAIIATVQQIDL